MGYPFELQGITNWFASRADLLTRTGVTLTETVAGSEYVPAARADRRGSIRSGFEERIGGDKRSLRTDRRNKEAFRRWR